MMRKNIATRIGAALHIQLGVPPYSEVADQEGISHIHFDNGNIRFLKHGHLNTITLMGTRTRRTYQVEGYLKNHLSFLLSDIHSSVKRHIQ